MRRLSGFLTVPLAGLLAAAVPAAAQPTVEEQIVEMVNAERWDNGQLPPLKHHSLLDACAGTHSSNMASRDFFAHCDPDEGTLPWDRMTAAGYSWYYAGENIAAGYGTAAEVMAGWMASPGHRANILSPNFSEIGVGYLHAQTDAGNVRIDSNSDCTPESTNGPFYRYWTQNFGSRYQQFPVVIDREAVETDQREVELYLYGSGWAQDMRIRNAGEEWPAWEPFTADVSWTLAPGNGTRTVEVELRNGAAVRTASDEIELTNQSQTAVPEIARIGSGLILEAPRPNPFRASTEVGFRLEEPRWVRVTVHDLSGRKLATLFEGQREAGDHRTRWNGDGPDGRKAAPGVYFLRLEAGGQRLSAKVMLLP